MIVRPLTGEIIPSDLATLVDEEARVDRYLRSLSPHYAYRRALRERIAELRGPAEMPPPRYRTETQGKVARCPRCGAAV